MPALERQELVAAPDRGRVFREPRRAGLADCAPSGRVRLDALARWAQDVAYSDLADADVSHGVVWVVRRTRLRVIRFPRFGEHFDVSTFCSGLGRMWAERRTTIAGADDDAPRAELVTLWVHLDAMSGRPTKLREDELAVWGESAGSRTVTARLRHPGPDEVKERCPWRFRATDCDLAGHVNNAAYLLPLEEEIIQDGDPESLDVEVEYRSPSQPGEKLVLRRGDRRWIVTPEGETHASLILAPLDSQEV
jgi:acyl-ACP thioesterase